MTKEKKSYDLHIDLPGEISREQMMKLVEKAAERAGLYISHIGSYSRKKYPNSIHWHFKRSKKEFGLIDATFWDVQSLFWLMIRFSEPKWVHEMAPRFQKTLALEVSKLKTG